ncbi:MAG TPA: hypothetical protein PKE51_06645, partial [Gemmatimonadaceae bacterium]|nr:hypothetical protein [Gemmatimonadaceae bacterium]
MPQPDLLSLPPRRRRPGPNAEPPRVASDGNAPQQVDHQTPSFAESWRFDLPASIVVLLVAIPLCLGIALASG